VDIIRTVYYIHGAELMKLIFAVLDVSSTVGLTRCYKTEGFMHLFQTTVVMNLLRLKKSDTCQIASLLPDYFTN